MHGDRLHVVIVLRTVRFVRHAVERLDRPAHTGAETLLNPAQQITNLFYDILYYDNFKPFFTTAGILAAMSLVCLAAATVLLRRQRYEYL